MSIVRIAKQIFWVLLALGLFMLVLAFSWNSHETRQGNTIENLLFIFPFLGIALWCLARSSLAFYVPARSSVSMLFHGASVLVSLISKQTILSKYRGGTDFFVWNESASSRELVFVKYCGLLMIFFALATPAICVFDLVFMGNKSTVVKLPELSIILFLLILQISQALAMIAGPGKPLQ
jgi:hypothetical protein